MPRVVFATCSAFPDGDPELVGLQFEWAVWNDPAVDWSAYDLVVIRSTWDYTLHVEEFLTWVHSLPRVANDADVVEWNHDKRYLGALHLAGIPTVPSRWGPCDLPDGRWVVKPRIGAGARGITVVEGAASIDADHFAQPYLDGIDDHGETAVVYLGGQLSHVARKRARLGYDKLDEEVEPRTPSAEEIDLADAVLDAIPFDRSELLYARVDLVQDRDGDPALLELELIEPSLFLHEGTGAPDRFTEAIDARL